MARFAVRALKRNLLFGTVALVTAALSVGAIHAAAQQNQTAANEKGIQGTWQGTLRMPYGPQLRTVARVTQMRDGTLKVMLYSIDQGGQPIPTASASFQNGTFKFKYAIAFLDGSFEGRLSADGNSISGTWTLGASKFPVVLERATPETAWSIPASPPKISRMAANANPSFEVATIKPSKPREKAGISWNAANVALFSYTLLDMIDVAYGVQRRQVVGGPKWMSSDKYDVDGKTDAPGIPSFDQVKTMIRKLLADRFQLTFHRETKKMSVYVLTVAKGGPKMHKGDPKGVSDVVFGQFGVLLARNATMDDVAQTMQRTVCDRPVVNDTGLPGTWDFLARFTPAGVNALLSNDAADAPPPLFTAIQEQMGLKLEAKKAPVPVLVIDRVEPPSPN